MMRGVRMSLGSLMSAHVVVEVHILTAAVHLDRELLGAAKAGIRFEGFFGIRDVEAIYRRRAGTGGHGARKGGEGGGCKKTPRDQREAQNGMPECRLH